MVAAPSAIRRIPRSGVRRLPRSLRPCRFRRFGERGGALPSCRRVARCPVSWSTVIESKIISDILPYRAIRTPKPSSEGGKTTRRGRKSSIPDGRKRVLSAKSQATVIYQKKIPDLLPELLRSRASGTSAPSQRRRAPPSWARNASCSSATGSDRQLASIFS